VRRRKIRTHALVTPTTCRCMASGLPKPLESSASNETGCPTHFVGLYWLLLLPPHHYESEEDERKLKTKMESGRAKTGKRKRVDDEWWKELRADWWQELGDHLETEILGRLPAEDVYRYRGVCDEWNVLLSSNYFITEAWPDATINKQPWLLLCDPFPNNPSMAFCFYTQTWKRCFSLSLPDGERSVKCRGSAGGLLLFDRGFEGDNVLVERDFSPPQVCNPYTGKSIQLPPMLAITWIKLRCIVEDNNGAYKVVVIGSNDNGESIVEMYDGSQQTWKILGPIPEHIMRLWFE
jgi:hypothetical protein